jgi:hypothetical protein
VSLVAQDIPKQNIQVDLDELHMEILDTQTAKVWQVMSGVGRAEYDALVVEPPYIKVGAGYAAMDEAYFARSPGADSDGPMELCELFGHTWGHCARPASSPELAAGEDGPRRLIVDKHHVVIYRAGRDLEFMTLPDGSEYVRVIAGEAPLTLPDGWSLRTRTLDEPVTIRLPSPTTVFFFPNGDSFQGPV